MQFHYAEMLILTIGLCSIVIGKDAYLMHSSFFFFLMDQIEKNEVKSQLLL